MARKKAEVTGHAVTSKERPRVSGKRMYLVGLPILVIPVIALAAATPAGLARRF